LTSLAAKTLRKLGYRVSVKALGDNYLQAIADSRNSAQIGFYGWQADYPVASAFFRPLFTCASFVPDSPARNNNASEFCDPRVDREIAHASSVQVANPTAAQVLWARVDRDLTDQAAWVPLYTPNSVDVLSKRVGNYEYSPSGFGMLLDQLWVR
jgi:peptide/nickel transport system substrate-binding protein